MNKFIKIIKEEIEVDKMFNTFVSDLKKYEELKNKKIKKIDFETCVDNWENEYNISPAKTTNTWKNFIEWCYENWKY